MQEATAPVVLRGAVPSRNSEGMLDMALKRPYELKYPAQNV